MDAPIGYSGAPYISNVTAKPHRIEKLEMEVSNIMLDEFPREILLIIASSLSQFEILNLLQVNKSFNEIFQPSLYNRITVDNGFSQFNYKEISLVQNTFVKTSYSLKMLLKRLISTPQRCQMMRHLHCQKLPSDINKIELQGYLSHIFPLLTNLKELNWYNSNDIDLKLLAKIPSSSLVKLCINSRLSHHLKLPEVSSQFSSLETFAICPFQNSENLMKIRSLFSFANLQNLKISRLFNKESLLIPPSNSLVTREDVLDLDLNTFKLIFTNIPRKLNLEKLSIDGVLIQPIDFITLSESVNLSVLKFLELVNLSEIIKINPQNSLLMMDIRNNELTDSSRSELRSLIEPNFITRLSQLNFKNLTDLKIDIRQGLVDSTPVFLKSLSGLQKLDIISRWNNTKSFQFDNFQNLILKLIDSISCNAQTLEKLSLELRLENTLINNESMYTLPNECLVQLLDGHYYPKLKGLRLNVFANFLISENYMISNKNFPSLKYLNLFGDDIYQKHMGLEVLNPGILDDFFKIQHVVVNLLQDLKTNLEYIMIDENKVFELKLDETNRMVDLIPRDGINDWFIGMVRTGFF